MCVLLGIIGGLIGSLILLAINSYIEIKDVDEICDYSDEMIEATKNGESRDDRDCKEGLIILKDLIR
jgi:hypothetical protein